MILGLINDAASVAESVEHQIRSEDDNIWQEMKDLDQRKLWGKWLKTRETSLWLGFKTDAPEWK